MPQSPIFCRRWPRWVLSLSAPLLPLSVLALSVLVPRPGEAQRLPAPSRFHQQNAAPAGAAPLNMTEKTALSKLFTRVRPATLRIEECDQARCTEPDSVGSAVLMSAGGLALTAYHVVFQAAQLSAVTSDHKHHAVTVVGYDDQHDLALLKVDLPRNSPFLPLAKAAPRVGDPVLAIGNGGGAFLRPQTGRLLALNAAAGRADFPPGTLQVNARLIPGDSGGPLLNAAGEVTGIVSFIHVQEAPEGQPDHITAYAVPVTASDPRLSDLKKGVKRDAPVLGVGLDGALSALVNLPATDFADANRELDLQLGRTPGAFFTSVVPGSPAARAGLQPLRYDQQGKRRSGDVVTAVGGRRVNNFGEFQAVIRQYAPGNRVTLSVLRGGKPLTLRLTLTGRAALRR